MKELLTQILEQLIIQTKQVQYQTKLLETLVEGTSLGAKPDGPTDVDMEKAMDLVLRIPMFAGLDKTKLGHMLKLGGD